MVERYSQAKLRKKIRICNEYAQKCWVSLRGCQLAFSSRQSWATCVKLP